MAAKPQSLLEQAALFAAALRFDDLPPAVLRAARLQLASVLAACHAGALDPKARAVAELAASAGGHRPSTLVPGGLKAPMHLAVLANAVHSMAFDHDDFLFLGHTGHSAVVVALAVAEARGASMREAIAAQVAANEVMGRLGAVCALGPQSAQFWNFIHLAGAAVAAGKLLGLTPEQLAHALALALAQPNFSLLPALLGSDAKLLGAAIPAADGVLAAQLAQRGFEGPLDILESPRGLGQVFSFAPLLQAFAGFGSAWVTETLAFKPYPGCAYLTAVTECLLSCMREYRRLRGYPLLSTEVASVEVQATVFTWLMDALSADAGAEGPLTAVAVNFSTPLTAAVALLNGRLTAEELAPARLARDERALRALARRVRVRLDPDLTLTALEHFEETVGAVRAIGGLGPIAISQFALGAGLLQSSALRESLPLLLHRGLLRRLARGLVRRERFDLGDARLPALRWPFGARVEIRLRSGDTLASARSEASGGPGDPGQADLVVEKLAREARPALGAPAALSLARRVVERAEMGEARTLAAEASATRVRRHA